MDIKPRELYLLFRPFKVRKSSDLGFGGKDAILWPALQKRPLPEGSKNEVGSEAFCESFGNLLGNGAGILWVVLSLAASLRACCWNHAVSKPDAVWSALLSGWTSPSSAICPDPVTIQPSLGVSSLATLGSGVAFLLPCTAAPQCWGGAGGSVQLLEVASSRFWKV